PQNESTVNAISAAAASAAPRTLVLRNLRTLVQPNHGQAAGRPATARSPRGPGRRLAAGARTGDSAFLASSGHPLIRPLPRSVWRRPRFRRDVRIATGDAAARRARR